MLGAIANWRPHDKRQRAVSGRVLDSYRPTVIGTEILIPCGEGILSKLETEAGRVSSPNVETFFDYFRPYWNEIVVPSFKLIAK
jgi:hypothetical protein